MQERPIQSIKVEENSKISFFLIRAMKIEQYHSKVLPSSFHLNGHA